MKRIKNLLPKKNLLFFAVMSITLCLTVTIDDGLANPSGLNRQVDTSRNEASPVPDIKVDGQDGPITISTSDTISVTVSLNAGGETPNADWWAILVKPSGNIYYYDLSSQAFLFGQKVTHQGPLFDVNSFQAISSSGLSQGTHTYYFGVDLTVDGTVNMANTFLDSVVVNVNSEAKSSAQLPDTGQTICYDNSSPITCPSQGQAFYGQDANYTINPLSYTDNGDGTVTDNVTGLMWQVNTTGASWQGAVSNCRGLSLAGFSDWRVPTAAELFGIIHAGKYNPSIDAAIFPGTFSSDYWSVTVSASDNTHAWRVLFYDGGMGNVRKSVSLYSRCVRGGQSAVSSFTDNGNGTVTDNITGLMWQQVDDNTVRNWQNALSYCQGVSLGGHSDWRLPNFKELESIIDRSQVFPSINGVYFPGADLSYYWTGTTSARDTHNAWVGDFLYGNILARNKSFYNYHARCVRGP